MRLTKTKVAIVIRMLDWVRFVEEPILLLTLMTFLLQLQYCCQKLIEEVRARGQRPVRYIIFPFATVT